jgi:predicted pyridoxine 5'-phosphate oxidase superfamily flavin-nucleotide-binding protein
MPAPPDALEEALERPQAQIGVLAIEPGTRQRIRLNGTARRTEAGVLVRVAEAFGNCTKYIQRRVPGERFAVPGERVAVPGERVAVPGERVAVPGERIEASAARSHRHGRTLDPRQAALVSGADTIFIASAHPERGADASHRGGRPGFVEVADGGRELVFPDYIGNRMFQTLGNLAVDPRAGLLLVDWETGGTLQITGRARILWDEQVTRSWPGAQRVVELTIDVVREHERVMPARWSLIEPYQRNPPVRRASLTDAVVSAPVRRS